MQTAEYLEGLVREQKEEWAQRAIEGRVYNRERPKTISYEDRTVVLIEKDNSYPGCDNLDKLSITTEKGLFVLNDMIIKSTVFMDGGGVFGLIENRSLDIPWKFRVVYGSKSLEMFKGNLYPLFHEMGHANPGPNDGEDIGLEVACWAKADEMIERLGLTLFENDVERELYRDVNLRSYDPYGENGFSPTSLMAQIDHKSFSFEIVSGLTIAATRGESLVELCTKLIEEKSAH